MINRTKVLACLLLCLVFAAACTAALGTSATQYPLWIGGTQVTDENCGSLEENHWKYDPSSHTITLKDYSYNGLGYEYTAGRNAAIYYNGTDNLTILLEGTNSVIQGKEWAYDEDNVIRSAKADCTVTIGGSGSLNAEMYDTWGGPAIICNGPLVFSGGSVKAIGGSGGISASKVTIKKEIVSVETQAFLDSGKAFSGTVVNEVSGVGYDRWKQPTGIPVDKTGKTLDYKEAGFPSVQFKLVYDPNGGFGTMESETVSEGGKVVLPDCGFEPPEGRKFSHWEVNGVDLIGEVGTEVLITRSCAVDGVIKVKAIWPEKPSATVKTVPQGQDKNYTGSAVALVTAGKAEDGTMQYILGKNAEDAPVFGWDEEIPTGTDAGTYYVWYRAAGDSTHSHSGRKCVTVVISPRAVSVTAKAQTVTEGSQPETGVGYVDADGLADGHTLSAVTLKVENGKIVPSAARITDNEEQDMTGNYDIKYVPGSLTVRDGVSVKVIFRVVNGEWDQGGSDDMEAVLTGFEGDTLKLKTEQIPGAGTKPAASCKAGSWDVTPDTETVLTQDTVYVYTYEEDPVYSVTAEGDGYIQGSGKDFVFTVKRSIRDAVTFDSFKSVTVDGNPVGEGNYSKTAGSLVLTLKTGYLDSLAAGEHKIVITFEDGEAEATLTVSQAAPVTTAPATASPTVSPTASPTVSPTASPTASPTISPTPSPAPTPAPTATPRPVPKTGDNGQPMIWIGLILFSLLGLLLCSAAWKASRKK